MYKMRGAIIFVITIAVLGGIRVLMSGGSIAKQLKKAEVELNKSCPKMIDEITRMDKVVAGERDITYHYTIIGVEDADMLNAKETLIQNTTNILRTNPDTKKLLDKKIIMSYVYKSQSGKQLFSFSVSN